MRAPFRMPRGVGTKKKRVAPKRNIYLTRAATKKNTNLAKQVKEYLEKAQKARFTQRRKKLTVATTTSSAVPTTTSVIPTTTSNAVSTTTSVIPTTTTQSNHKDINSLATLLARAAISKRSTRRSKSFNKNVNSLTKRLTKIAVKESGTSVNQEISSLAEQMAKAAIQEKTTTTASASSNTSINSLAEQMAKAAIQEKTTTTAPTISNTSMNLIAKQMANLTLRERVPAKKAKKQETRQRTRVKKTPMNDLATLFQRLRIIKAKAHTKKRQTTLDKRLANTILRQQERRKKYMKE